MLKSSWIVVKSNSNLTKCGYSASGFRLRIVELPAIRSIRKAERHGGDGVESRNIGPQQDSVQRRDIVNSEL
jgi:hypothetical protein